jgi:hypothetical protein
MVSAGPDDIEDALVALMLQFPEARIVQETVLELNARPIGGEFSFPHVRMTIFGEHGFLSAPSWYIARRIDEKRLTGYRLFSTGVNNPLGILYHADWRPIDTPPDSVSPIDGEIQDFDIAGTGEGRQVVVVHNKIDETGERERHELQALTVAWPPVSPSPSISYLRTLEQAFSVTGGVRSWPFRVTANFLTYSHWYLLNSRLFPHPLYGYELSTIGGDLNIYRKRREITSTTTHMPATEYDAISNKILLLYQVYEGTYWRIVLESIYERQGGIVNLNNPSCATIGPQRSELMTSVRRRPLIGNNGFLIQLEGGPKDTRIALNLSPELRSPWSNRCQPTLNMDHPKAVAFPGMTNSAGDATLGVPLTTSGFPQLFEPPSIADAGAGDKYLNFREIWFAQWVWTEIKEDVEFDIEDGTFDVDLIRTEKASDILIIFVG